MTSENGRTSSETRDVACYIASMAGELAQVARRHNLDTLAYLLDMARLEADEISKRWSREGAETPGPR